MFAQMQLSWYPMWSLHTIRVLHEIHDVNYWQILDCEKKVLLRLVKTKSFKCRVSFSFQSEVAKKYIRGLIVWQFLTHRFGFLGNICKPGQKVKQTTHLEKQWMHHEFMVKHAVEVESTTAQEEQHRSQVGHQPQADYLTQGALLRPWGRVNMRSEDGAVSNVQHMIHCTICEESDM